MPAVTRDELLARLSDEELAKEPKSLNRLLYELARDVGEKSSNSISLAEWNRYRDILVKLSDKAAEEFRDAVWIYGGRWNAVGLGYIDRDQIIEYAYELVTKYSEGAAEVACEFYDALAALAGANVPPAIPAEPAAFGEVAKTINGTLKTQNPEIVANALGRLVKQCGQDTTLQNAERDQAKVAWIPVGDTCAYCIYLASEGWVNASEEMTRDKHAKHIHANCDCAYAVQFKEDFDIAGYKKGKYLRMYQDADGNTRKQKINAMRREFYAENAEEINEQKRDAYAKRKELNEPSAEEFDVN